MLNYAFLFATILYLVSTQAPPKNFSQDNEREKQTVLLRWDVSPHPNPLSEKERISNPNTPVFSRPMTPDETSAFPLSVDSITSSDLRAPSTLKGFQLENREEEKPKIIVEDSLASSNSNEENKNPLAIKHQREEKKIVQNILTKYITKRNSIYECENISTTISWILLTGSVIGCYCFEPRTLALLITTSSICLFRIIAPFIMHKLNYSTSYLSFSTIALIVPTTVLIANMITNAPDKTVLIALIGSISFSWVFHFLTIIFSCNK
jgi:hypothetical protein